MKEEHRDSSRHTTSKNISLRLSFDMLEKLTAQAKKEGRSRRDIIVSLIDEYLSQKED